MDLVDPADQVQLMQDLLDQSCLLHLLLLSHLYNQLAQLSC